MNVTVPAIYAEASTEDNRKPDFTGWIRETQEGAAVIMRQDKSLIPTHKQETVAVGHEVASVLAILSMLRNTIQASVPDAWGHNIHIHEESAHACACNGRMDGCMHACMYACMYARMYACMDVCR